MYVVFAKFNQATCSGYGVHEFNRATTLKTIPPSIASADSENMAARREGGVEGGKFGTRRRSKI